MDNNEREKFWNVLKNLHNNDEASMNMLTEASHKPKTLCRFRPVSEHSLQQLQENKLFFSSADHYDDPFDTYFYIDVDQMVPVYEEMRKVIVGLRTPQYERRLIASAATIAGIQEIYELYMIL